MPHERAGLELLRKLIVAQAGGYLRNPVRQPGQTCEVCTTPVQGFERCAACKSHYWRPGRRADAVGFVTYAIGGEQSGYVMRGYKAASPVEEHVSVVFTLLVLGFSHTACLGQQAGSRVTHWATVPSLSNRAGEHPLHRLASRVAHGAEAAIESTTTPSDVPPRGLSANHFRVRANLHGAHVLLIDDTWTTGGHIQSAVLALRAAGAARVSALVVARWLRREYGDNQRFIREQLTGDFDPLVCPWTGRTCSSTDH